MRCGQSWESIDRMKQILIHPRGLRFQVAPGETILEAAIRQQYALPHSCDNGVCEVCSGKLLAGHCHLRNRQQLIEAGQEGADYLLLCLAEPQSDRSEERRVGKECRSRSHLYPI